MKIYLKMKKFIVLQMQIDGETVVGNNKNISMSNVVRYIEAESNETGIGKFVLATQQIKAMKKMDIECYELSELKTA